MLIVMQTTLLSVLILNITTDSLPFRGENAHATCIAHALGFFVRKNWLALMRIVFVRSLTIISYSFIHCNIHESVNVSLLYKVSIITCVLFLCTPQELSNGISCYIEHNDNIHILVNKFVFTNGALK